MISATCRREPFFTANPPLNSSVFVSPVRAPIHWFAGFSILICSSTQPCSSPALCSFENSSFRRTMRSSYECMLSVCVCVCVSFSLYSVPNRGARTSNTANTLHSQQFVAAICSGLCRLCEKIL